MHSYNQPKRTLLFILYSLSTLTVINFADWSANPINAIILMQLIYLILNTQNYTH